MCLSRPWHPSPAPPLPASADPAAAAWLAQAVTALSPDKCPFVETTVWQRVRLQHLDYESEGRYTGGTGQRYRLEFHTRTGGSKGTLVQVCDGSSLWQGTGAVPGRWVEVRRIRLDKSTAGPVMPASLGAQGFSFSGVAPLLNRLREQMVWVRQEQATLQDADCIQLTGVWPEALVRALALPANPGPRTCQTSAGSGWTTAPSGPAASSGSAPAPRSAPWWRWSCARRGFSRKCPRGAARPSSPSSPDRLPWSSCANQASSLLRGSRERSKSRCFKMSTGATCLDCATVLAAGPGSARGSYASDSCRILHSPSRCRLAIE